MSPGQRSLVLLLVALVLTASLACRRSRPAVQTPVPTSPPATPTATPLPPPTPTPINPAAVLRRSGQVMQNLKTFHFQLRHEKGTTQLLPNFFVDEAKGDVVFPDEISVSFSGRYGTGFAIKSALITLGDASFMTNPLNNEWQAIAQGLNPLAFFNPAGGIASMLSRVRQVSLLPDTAARPKTFRIAGSLPAEALAPLLGPTLQDTTVRVELTIDSKKMYLYQAIITGHVKPTDVGEVVRIVNLSAFNEPVTIKAPL